MNNNLAKRKWVDRYNPETLDDYIFQNPQTKQIMMNIIEDNLIGHVLLSGIQGTGKTAFSNLILSSLNVDRSDVLYIDASVENRVEVIRNKIHNFASLMPTGEYRVIQLEESDFLSLQAQGMLRKLLEDEVDNVKFICTCNYVNKIMPALKSRFHYQIELSAPNKTDLIKRVGKILKTEKVSFEAATVIKYIDVHYPDFRKILNSLQSGVVDGVLLDPSNSQSCGDWKIEMLAAIGSGMFLAIHELVEANIPENDLEDAYSFLYKNITEHPSFPYLSDNWKMAQIKIAEYLHKHSFSALKKQTFATLIIELDNIAGG
jgi:replication factor C small subunit